MSPRSRLIRLALVALLSFLGGYALARRPVPGAVAATVNGQPISTVELQRETDRRFGKEVLRDLIHQCLIQQQAERQKLKVDNQAIEQRLTLMKSQPQVQAGLQSGELREEDLRRNLATLIPLDQMVEEKLTEQEEEAYFQLHQEELERVEVRHILVSTVEEADKVAQLARKPKADFAALAKTHSQDPQTRDRGGHMGWLHRNELEPELAEELFSLKEGEVSDPLTGGDGIHVFCVTQRQVGLQALLPTVRERLVAEKRGEFLEKLKAQARIEVFPPYQGLDSLKAEE